MRKLGIFVTCAALSLAAICNQTKTLQASAAEAEKLVYIGGMSAGFTLKTGGAQIIGLSEIATENGTTSPALKAGLRAGDIIYKVGGIKVESIAHLNELVSKSKGNSLKFDIKRGEECFSVDIQPIKEKITEKYKVGVLIRDSVSGIGTVTYIEKDSGRFGSLGHAVSSEYCSEMQIDGGAVYECNIVGVQKGVRGRAGELRGMFINDKLIGNAEKLCNCGIFGQISQEFTPDELMCAVASSAEAKPGKAYIYSTVDGISPKKYEVEIVKVDKNNRENKNYVIKITDDALLQETGGIVQGMSGSPIIQKDKMIGAITHVFLNDPTRGYGIDIHTMLNE